MSPVDPIPTVGYYSNTFVHKEKDTFTSCFCTFTSRRLLGFLDKGKISTSNTDSTE